MKVASLDAIRAVAGPAPKQAAKPTVLRVQGAAVGRDLKERARRYVLAPTRATVTQGTRDKEAYKVARQLWNDFGLPEADAADLLTEWNAVKVSPPLSEGELVRILRSASKRGADPQKGRGSRAVGQPPASISRPTPSGNGHNTDPVLIGPADAGDAWEPDAVSDADVSFERDELEQPEDPNDWHPRPMSTATLMAGTSRPDWLAIGALLCGEPGVVGAPSKSIKTTAMIDLAVSLATGTEFLGEFRVPVPRRVLFLSGESGDFIVRETVRSIAAFKQVDPRRIEGLTWEFSVPQLGVASHRLRLSQLIEDTQAEVMVLLTVISATSLVADPVSLPPRNFADTIAIQPSQIARVVIDSIALSNP